MWISHESHLSLSESFQDQNKINPSTKSKSAWLTPLCQFYFIPWSPGDDDKSKGHLEATEAIWEDDYI